MYSTQKGTDMDLKRHGFKEKDNAAELPDDVNKYRNSQSQIGSKHDIQYQPKCQLDISFLLFHGLSSYYRRV